MRAKPLSLAIALCAMSVRGRAHAEERPAISLAVDTCVAVEAADVRKIVEIELHTTITDAGLTKVTARCREKLIELTVEDPITGKSLVRNIDVASTDPKARARLLALAITELVSASWTELETNPTPAVPPAGPPPPPAAKAAARDVAHTRMPSYTPSQPLRIVALVDRRAFLARTAWVTGFGVRVAQDTTAIGWSADMIASQGTAAATIGDVAMDVVGVGLAVTLGATWSRVSARAHAGARFGAARLSGVPRGADVEGRSVRGPWGGPYLGGSISFVPIKPLLIEASLESGYVVVPVHARVDGERQVSVGGVWIAGAIALGVTL